MAKVDTYQHPELGQALRFLRARSGLSQARVADQVAARGGRLTAVWLSRIESAADRGGGPYPSVALLDRILTVLGSDRAELERLLRERPWGRVGEGAEWDASASPPAASAPAAASLPAAPSSPTAASPPAAAPAGPPPPASPPAAARAVGPPPPASPGAAARAVGPPTPASPPAAARAVGPPPPASPGAPDIAAEAAELGARYARLPRAAQLELLARARELS